MKTLRRPEHQWSLPDRAGHAPTATGHATRRDITRAAVTALSPSVLLIGVVYHPHLGDLRDKDAVSGALSADTARWGISHLVVGLGAALVLLAFLSVDAYLRESGLSSKGAVGVPFLVVGTVLFAFLPAMEIAMLGAYDAGADVEEVMASMDTWFVPVLGAGAVVLAVGTACFVAAVVEARMFGPGLTGLVVAGLCVSALARFVPFGPALYIGVAGLVVGLLPIAAVMLTRPRAGEA